MRLLVSAIPIALTVLCSCSTAPSRPAVRGYVETAEVIKVEPLYTPVQIAQPVNECWLEKEVWQARPSQGAYLGPVGGGIIGGAIGSRLASGRNKTPMTVAGALVGASLGRRLSSTSRQPPTVSHVRRCKTVTRYEQRQHLLGYRVDYRYEGRTFTTQTSGHPGRFIRVRVDVDPVGGSY